MSRQLQDDGAGRQGRQLVSSDTVMKGSAVGVILTLGICILRWHCVYKYHLYDDAKRSALPTKGQEIIVLLRPQAAMID